MIIYRVYTGFQHAQSWHLPSKKVTTCDTIFSHHWWPVTWKHVKRSELMNNTRWRSTLLCTPSLHDHCLSTPVDGRENGNISNGDVFHRQNLFLQSCRYNRNECTWPRDLLTAIRRKVCTDTDLKTPFSFGTNLLVFNVTVATIWVDKILTSSDQFCGTSPYRISSGIPERFLSYTEVWRGRD